MIPTVTYVYLAASSTEIPRVMECVALVEEHNRNYPYAQIILTHDWWRVIQERGDANPVGAGFSDRLKYATEDIKGVREADFLWLLMPETAASVGCYWEAGYADALGKEIIISGNNLERSIFTTRGACFSADQGALEYLSDCATQVFDVARVEVR